MRSSEALWRSRFADLMALLTRSKQVGYEQRCGFLAMQFLQGRRPRRGRAIRDQPLACDALQRAEADPRPTAARPHAAAVEWAADRRGVPCGSVRDLHEVFTDPRLAAREMVAELEHATIGALRLLGIPVKRTEGIV